MICSAIKKLLQKKDFDDQSIVSNLIKNYSKEYGLDPIMVSSLIMTESGGNVWAFRYEPAFYKKYLQGKKRSELSGHVPEKYPTYSSELQARSISIGLVQMMGETARWQGFDRDYLFELFLPEHNIKMGCKFLRYLLNKHQDIIDEKSRYHYALLRYNGGGDKDYPNRVFKKAESGEYKKVLI